MLGRMLHDPREHPFAFVHDRFLCLEVNFHSEIYREIFNIFFITDIFVI